MHQPIETWFGGPMTAAIYEAHDFHLDAVVTKIDFRRDNPILPPDAKVVEVLQSKPGDTEASFHERVLRFVLPKEF